MHVLFSYICKHHNAIEGILPQSFESIGKLSKKLKIRPRGVDTREHKKISKKINSGTRQISSRYRNENPLFAI